jgi:hypothetical protein
MISEGSLFLEILCGSVFFSLPASEIKRFIGGSV